jgi:hypothetical protein
MVHPEVVPPNAESADLIHAASARTPGSRIVGS